MQTKFSVIVVSIAAVIAVVAGNATAARTTTVPCRFKLTSQVPPTDTSGVDFGFVTCGKPFGKGVQYDALKETLTSTTTASSRGSFTDYFGTGTTHGTFALAVKLTGPKTATYRGPLKITGGTGAFSKADGSATIRCSTADEGTHTSCTGKLKLTSG